MRKLLVLLLACAVAMANGRAPTVQRLLMPGAAGVSSWFSTVTYVEQPPLVSVYVSGTIGTPFPSQPGTPHVVPGGVGNETTQALRNVLGAVNYTCLQVADAYHCSQHDWRWSITKCRVALTLLTATEEAAFNAAWVAFFADPLLTPPARMASQGATLVAGAAVELDCDAVFGID